MAVVICFVFLLSCLSLYLVVLRITDWSVSRKKISVERGNRVIAGLRAYYADHASYPTDLQDLVPAYLPAIALPLTGDQQWFYFVETDRQTFTLQFSTHGGYPSMNYCSGTPYLDWYEDH